MSEKKLDKPATRAISSKDRELVLPGNRRFIKIDITTSKSIAESPISEDMFQVIKKPMNSDGGNIYVKCFQFDDFSNKNKEEVDTYLHEIISPNPGQTIDYRTREFVALLSSRIRETDIDDMEKLIDIAMPKVNPVHTLARMEQSRRNAEVRKDFIEQYGLFSTTEINELYGSTSNNKSALVSKWKKEKKIFSVKYQGNELYPAIQFDDDYSPHSFHK